MNTNLADFDTYTAWVSNFKIVPAVERFNDFQGRIVPGVPPVSISPFPPQNMNVCNSNYASGMNRGNVLDRPSRSEAH
jgi:hypothetical protein